MIQSVLSPKALEAREGSALSHRGGSRASGVRRQAGIVRERASPEWAETGP